jgi:hypothetical protein
MDRMHRIKDSNPELLPILFSSPSVEVGGEDSGRVGFSVSVACRVCSKSEAAATVNRGGLGNGAIKPLS